VAKLAVVNAFRIRELVARERIELPTPAFSGMSDQQLTDSLL
jgi:hypothetical protein